MTKPTPTILTTRPRPSDKQGEAVNTVAQVVGIGGGPFVSRARQPGRGVHYYGWHLHRYTATGKRMGTDRTGKAAWYDYGNAHFLPGNDGDEKAALMAALTEAGRRYGVWVWRRNRMGDYVPAEAAERYPLVKRGS